MGSRWRGAGALACAGALLLQGCYETLPMQQGVAPVAERVVLTLNDQGRVGLASKLGPAVDKVEGAVQQANADAMDLKVIRVTQIGGSSSLWNGERVSVQKDFIAGYAIRRLSRTRTALLVGGVTVGMLAFIFGKSLLLGGGGVELPPGGDPGPQTLRTAP
ncbi:MAG TPA: hypothetical protein VG916_09125 [Gemmatimonadaceae bacterium]|nr:hypothetical protein [Gemmatimonadaceae bacterium]